MTHTEAGKSARGEHHPRFDRLHREDAFEYSRSAHRVPEDSFQGVDGDGFHSCPRESDGFHLVVVGRGCAVDIDKGQIGRCALAGSKHIAQREIASFARSRWAGDVVGIVAHNADREVPRGGRGQLLVGGEHHRCSRFAEVQPGAVGIEGAAGRIAQRFEGLKARHDESRLHIATADHRVAPTAAFQQARSHHKCRDARDAGVGNDHRRAAVVQLGRDDFGRRAEAHALPR